jgi:hypothetical protein
MARGEPLGLISEGQPLIGQTQKPQTIILELLARAA